MARPKSAISVLAILLAAFMGGAGWAGEPRSLDPPVYLSDGEEFKTWEVPLTFSRTYHVDGSHPRASDENPGTESLPFSTINRAAREPTRIQLDLRRQE